MTVKAAGEGLTGCDDDDDTDEPSGGNTDQPGGGNTDQPATANQGGRHASPVITNPK